MGEAKRRREARENARTCGNLVPRPATCPGCGSRNIAHIAPSSPGLPGINRLSTREYGACLDCRALWEAFPPLYAEDEVEAEPCDNCAFRPGSPEQQDTEGWKKLIDSLGPREDGFFSGQFYCHKHVPLDMAAGPGNFLFPTRPDGTLDLGRMRSCSGFLRMFWARAKKVETAPNV